MVQPCRSIFMAAVSLLAAGLPAAAMNREGHDDWMLDFPPGIEAFTGGKDQKPLPSPRCPVSWETLKDNPYEQIPLPSHGCGPAPSGGKNQTAK